MTSPAGVRACAAAALHPDEFVETDRPLRRGVSRTARTSSRPARAQPRGHRCLDVPAAARTIAAADAGKPVLFRHDPPTRNQICDHQT